jgi:hypothetical protein
VELSIKLVITLLVIVFAFKALHWTWTSHIDLKATVERYIRKEPKIADVVATRDPNKIYQNGKAVGQVTGEVRTQNDQLVFEEITDTSALNHGEPFEYQRLRVRIVEIESLAGIKSTVSSAGSVIKQAVLEQVVCERVE